MKKRYIVLSILGLILGYIAKTDYWFEDEREVYFPITKEQIRAHAKALQASNEFKNALNANRPPADELAFFEMLQKKLNSEYPIESNLNNQYEREVSRRLGLLKTMQYQWPDQESFKQLKTQDLKNFFQTVVRNEKENILVRRQAFKNWLSVHSDQELYLKYKNENQKQRLAQLVNFSDAQMMHSLSTVNEN